MTPSSPAGVPAGGVEQASDADRVQAFLSGLEREADDYDLALGILERTLKERRALRKWSGPVTADRPGGMSPPSSSLHPGGTPVSEDSTDLVGFAHSTSTQGLESPGPATFPPNLAFLQAEHEQRMTYARIEHERRMQVIEAEAALVAERRRRLAEEVAVVDGRPGARAGVFSAPASLETIRAVLVNHLGTSRAADAWLNSPETGYPTTALDAIREGKAALVMADLEQQWGPSPSYA